MSDGQTVDELHEECGVLRAALFVLVRSEREMTRTLTAAQQRATELAEENRRLRARVGRFGG